MNQVAERLRNSRNEEASALYRAGFEAGRRWAANNAKFGELKNVEDLLDCVESGQYSGFDPFSDDENDAFTAAERVAFSIIHGQKSDDDIDRDESTIFWEAIEGDVAPDGEWVRGFCEGAIDLFDSVKKRI